MWDAKTSSGREARRIACVERCKIEFGRVETSSGSFEGCLWNLSSRGAYVAADCPPPSGITVRIAFSPPGESQSVKAEARVVWQNPRCPSGIGGLQAGTLPPGCGLEFLNIDPADRTRIEEHVRKTPPYDSIRS
jgi:hypothetical protein